MTTPPPGFWPKVSPKGLSTSTSMFLDAPAVLALTTSPRLPATAPLLFIPAEEQLCLCSNNDEPWKADFCTDRKKGHNCICVICSLSPGKLGKKSMQLTCAAKRGGVDGGGTDVALRVWLTEEAAAATAEAEAADMFAGSVQLRHGHKLG
ncbi:hypothetical protein BHE74_00011451 [Ensete ventricosum]|nr:hypothetical protein BHE74_00011451 [Ensete ventricosum]RZR83199.1 hypothetical protein BHM03_00009767 [Ensete ventricosum]